MTYIIVLIIIAMNVADIIWWRKKMKELERQIDELTKPGGE